MKKVISLFLSIFLALTLMGCTHTPAGGNDPATPPTQNGGTGENVEFTVQIELNGETFTQTNGITAVWSNKQGVYQAPFGTDNVARVTGPDGDYKVTLGNLPDGYSYNPNAHYATNRMNDITIEIFELNETDARDTGGGLYESAGIINVKAEGAYRTTLAGKKGKKKGGGENDPVYENVVYYQFEPKISGKYIIESWVDTTFNVINPFVDVYTGSGQAKYFNRTCDEGGESDTYTKNFSYSVQVYDDQISSGGQVVFAFGIHATHKTDSFPVTVDFRIYRYEDNIRDGKEAYMIQPEHDFSKTVEWETGTWTWAEGKSTVFDGSKFKLADDGFYHLTDENGEILPAKLYAMITTSTEEERPFAKYQGTTVGLSSFTSGSLPSNPLQNINGVCYNEFVDEYAKYCRNNVYPVTEELKELFQQFAISQRYFADGQGWFEKQTGVYATENDQWLFMCGYYV